MKSPTVILIAIAAATSGLAQDWLQFRGPRANGVATASELRVRMDDATRPAWSVSLPGRGLSSPIIVGERVFVTASSGPKQDRLHVLCLDASDGALQWERQFWATGRTMCHPKTCVAAPTPTSDGERVFAIFSSNDLVCLDLDGNLLWLRGLTLDYPNASNSLGLSTSLVVVNGVLIAQVQTESDSFAAGIDVRTGANRWKRERPKGANWSSPVVFRDPSGRALVGLQSEAGFTAMDPATGNTAWEVNLPAAGISSTAVGEGRVFVPARGLSAVAIPAADARPTEVWQNGQLRPGTASPLLLGERVYTVNDAGVLTAGDAASGKRLWQLRLKGPFSASPVSAGGLIYLVNEKGLVQVVDPAKPEGEVVGELELKATILGTPALGAGALFVRSDTTLWKFAGATGPGE